MLESKRLLIRPYQKVDEEAVYEVINSRGIYETTLNIPFPYPKEQVKVWLHFTVKNSQYERGYEWGIFSRQGHYIGNIGVVNIDHTHQSGEITYFIGEHYWNQGYATEAVGAMLHFAFIDLALERVQGRCMVRNLASKRVMEKCGFLAEGIARHEVKKCGGYEDVWHAAILREDYFKQKELKDGYIDI